MILLSLIVPIYKVELYLRQCVESLLLQDLPRDQYEIILVDDGSPDGCHKICDDYAAVYPGFIRVVHRKNGGLSAARNSGLEVVQGKYVQFVDSDDYIEPNVLGALIEQCEREQLDVLKFDYRNVRLVTSSETAEHISTVRERYATPISRVYEVFEPNKSAHYVDRRTEISDGGRYLADRMGYGCYATQFVLRRSLVCNGNRLTLPFKEGVYYEDTEWTPRMLLAARRVNATTRMVYNYLNREGSITTATSPEKRRKVLNDKMLLVDSLQQTAKQAPNNRWFRSEIAGIALSLLSIIAFEFWDEHKTLLRQLQTKHIYPLKSHFAIHNPHKLRLVNLSPLLYCYLLRLKHKRL